mmetsp:Transcript_4209/g.10120  ORF Transcript_4209/g.10120 Transcript_4209/m.10120 type:complete len:341 (+) Transcript_4209:419-1441(+)
MDLGGHPHGALRPESRCGSVEGAAVQQGPVLDPHSSQAGLLLADLEGEHALAALLVEVDRVQLRAHVLPCGDHDRHPPPLVAVHGEHHLAESGIRERGVVLQLRLQEEAVVLAELAGADVGPIQHCELRGSDVRGVRRGQGQSQDLQQVALHHVSDLPHTVEEAPSAVEAPRLELRHHHLLHGLGPPAEVPPGEEAGLDERPELHQVPVHEEAEPMVDDVQIRLRDPGADDALVKHVGVCEARAEGLLAGHVHTVLGALAPMVDGCLRPRAEDERRHAQVDRHPLVGRQARRHVGRLGPCVSARPDVDADVLHEPRRRAITLLRVALPPTRLLEAVVERR